MQIPEFLEVTPELWTSGQPAREDFALLARNGVELVINLSAAPSPTFLPDEAQWVVESGMQYVHLPVSWTAPQIEDFALFAAILSAAKNRRVLVHCAQNLRVSAFVFLFKTLVEGENEVLARRRMEKVWAPDAIWSAFTDEVRRELR